MRLIHQSHQRELPKKFVTKNCAAHHSRTKKQTCLSRDARAGVLTSRLDRGRSLSLHARDFQRARRARNYNLKSTTICTGAHEWLLWTRLSSFLVVALRWENSREAFPI